MTIYWYENSTGIWILRQTNSSVQNGTYYWTFLQATNYFTTYYWKAVVNDSIHNTTAIFHFTTISNQPLTISSPSPANQSTNISIATPYWLVTIEDPENDTIIWTIENSLNVGSTSGNNDINGQKSCPLSGLQYNTTYTTYVNATDAGNCSWVNETFWFTTAEEYAPTISNEYPPNRNTYIDLQPTCHVDVHDIEGDNLTIYWYENSTGSWALLQTDSNVSANSTVYWTFSQASSYSTTHYWKVVVDDGTYNTTAIYHFTTKPKPSAPSPGGGGSSGYTPLPNRHPIANITGLHTGYINETLIFYAYYSYDPDGYITGYRWDFENDGVFDTDWLEDILITCHYPLPGNYTIRLQVKDDDGAITTTSHSMHIIQLEPPLQLPIPKINGPYYGYTHENVTFNSNGSYDPDGTIINYTWNFGDGNKSYLKNPVHSYAEPGNHTVTLKVTDDNNLSNITTTEAIIIDKEIKESEERKLPLMFPLFLLLALIAALLAFIFIRHKGYRFTLFIEKLDKTTNNNVEEEIDELLFLSELEKNRHKTAEAEVETLLSELMKIMYSDDVDAKFATDQLGISAEKLKTLVDKLVKRGLLRYTSDNEVEITEQGIKYITI
jgi:PKD repeat protein